MEKAKLSEKDRYILRLDHWVEVTQANWRNVIKIRTRTPTAKDFQTATRDGTRKLLRCLFFQRRAPCLHDSDEEPKCSGSLVLFRHPPLLLLFSKSPSWQSYWNDRLIGMVHTHTVHATTPWECLLWMNILMMVWSDGAALGGWAGPDCRLVEHVALSAVVSGHRNKNIMQPWGQSKENKIKHQEMIKRMRRMRSQVWTGFNLAAFPSELTGREPYVSLAFAGVHGFI